MDEKEYRKKVGKEADEMLDLIGRMKFNYPSFRQERHDVALKHFLNGGVVDLAFFRSDHFRNEMKKVVGERRVLIEENLKTKGYYLDGYTTNTMNGMRKSFKLFKLIEARKKKEEKARQRRKEKARQRRKENDDEDKQQLVSENQVVLNDEE